MKRLLHMDILIPSVASLVALALAFAPPLLWGYRALRYGGYYGALFVLLFFCLWFLCHYRKVPKTSSFRLPYFWPTALALIVFQVVMLLATPNVFRVLDDEAVLMNTALSLHEEKELFAATKGYWIDGEFEILAGTLDKRPFLYAFLLSLVHELLGYRPENAFLLNAGLSLVACLTGFRLLAVWFGVLPGSVAILALVSTPAFIAAGNGAGFEMLNFCLLGLLAVAVRHFLDSKDPSAGIMICFVTILLAYARYESVLFVLPVGMLLLWHRWSRGKTALHGLTALVPFLLVPYVWLFRCTLARVGSWAQAEAESLPVFSLQYLGDNIIDAIRYLFFFEPLSEAHPLLTYGGSIGLIFLLVRLLPGFYKKGFLCGSFQFEHLIFWLVGYGLLIAVLMMYFWSSFMDVMSQRMALPLFWCFAVGLAYAVSRFALLGRAGTRVVLAVVIFFILSTAPLRIEATQRNFERNVLACLQTEKWRWLQKLDFSYNKLLFVDNNPAIWTALRVPAIEWAVARERAAQVRLHQTAGTFEAIFCVQVGNRLSPYGEWLVPEKQHVNGWHLAPEPVFSIQLTERTRVEIRQLMQSKTISDIAPVGAAASKEMNVLSLP